MQHGVPLLHTAEEMPELSNLAHMFEGIILGLAALVALYAAVRNWRSRMPGVAHTPDLVWPALIAVAGLSLLGYLFIPHHGIAQARAQYAFILGDPQQRQHVWLGLLVVVGGSAELISRARAVRSQAFVYAWPVTVALAGVSFLVHTQHGTDPAVERAIAIHRGIGGALLLAALLRAAQVWQAAYFRRIIPPRERTAVYWSLSVACRLRWRWRQHLY